MEPIELTQPRVVPIESRGRTYTLTVKPIPREAWLRYFASVVSLSEYKNGQRINSFDNSTPLRELAESVIVDAEGYQTDVPLREIADWQKKLPASHLAAVGEALASARPSEMQDYGAIALGTETVVLDAVWGAREGKLLLHRRLRHVLRTPTAEQQRRFARDSSRSVVVGAGRAGKTRWLGPQATLAELYDELVERVEGYTVNGSTPEGAAIASAMDTYHKVAAADALFSAAAPAIDETDAEERQGAEQR